MISKDYLIQFNTIGDVLLELKKLRDERDELTKLWGAVYSQNIGKPEPVLKRILRELKVEKQYRINLEQKEALEEKMKEFNIIYLANEEPEYSN
jgi:hypothetical protein